MANDEANQRGGTHDRENTESQAKGHTPCELLRAGALPELVGDGADDPALEAGWLDLGIHVGLYSLWKRAGATHLSPSSGTDAKGFSTVIPK